MMRKITALALSLCLLTLCSCTSAGKQAEAVTVTSVSEEQNTSIMQESTPKETVPMNEIDFSRFGNVTVTGTDINSLSKEDLSVVVNRKINSDDFAFDYEKQAFESTGESREVK